LGQTKKGTYLFFAALFIWLAIFTDKSLPTDSPEVQSSKVIVHTAMTLINVTLWIYGVVNSNKTARVINETGSKICPFCGQKISIDETFCRFCRKAV
jgi:integral membrane sensor domain MASE1